MKYSIINDRNLISTITLWRKQGHDIKIYGNILSLGDRKLEINKRSNVFAYSIRIVAHPYCGIGKKFSFSPLKDYHVRPLQILKILTDK